MRHGIRRSLLAAIVAAVVAGGGVAAVLVSHHGAQAPAGAAGAAPAASLDARPTVPELVQVRLDRAKQALQTAGFGHRTHGGGLLGVLDEGNWVVCRSRPAAGTHLDAGTKVELWVERQC